jgi:hypothetical protein
MASVLSVVKLPTASFCGEARLRGRRKSTIVPRRHNSDHKPRALSCFASGKTGRRKAAFVIAAHNSRILQQFRL